LDWRFRRPRHGTRGFTAIIRQQFELPAVNPWGRSYTRLFFRGERYPIGKRERVL
jgi:hypothetical protein